MLFATGHLGADFWSGLVAAVACRCMPLQIAVISFNLSQQQQQQRQQQQMLPLASQPARPKIVFVCYAPRSMRIFRLFALVSIRQCEMRIKNAVSNAHRPPSHPNPCHPMRHSEPIPPPRNPRRRRQPGVPMHNCCLYEKISPNGVLHYLPPDAALPTTTTTSLPWPTATK